MDKLTLGEKVQIDYLQPFNGAGASRWKVGTVAKVTPKWVLLLGHRGGWIPREGIIRINKW